MDFALPYQWLEHCYSSPAAQCQVETITLEDIARINKVVNEAITPRQDTAGLDIWTAFPSDRMGDCDDYAVTKRAALISLGFTGEMRVAMGWIEQEGKAIVHTVLEVDYGGKAYVLDNLAVDYLYTTNDPKRPAGWKPMAMQSKASVSWKLP